MRCLPPVLVLLLLAGCEPRPAPPDAPEPELATLLRAAPGQQFAVAEGQREFSFPADHGAHPAYRNEWWYVTGNLDSRDGRRFGYELTLFRFALTAADDDDRRSGWATRQVYVGHLALTDVAAGRFIARERFARGANGLAGATTEPLRIWLYDWQLRHRRLPGQPAAWYLSAADGDLRLDLVLVPQRPPVLNGQGGLSQKSSADGNASWYYSVPRLATTGTLETAGERHVVEGLSWLDREWSSSALAPEQRGWDWFALQLDDGSDLMYYRLRRSDGSADPHSAGTWVATDGSVTSLAGDDVLLDVLDWWDSPAGGRYPARWRLRVPSRHVDLRIRPVLPEQELHTWVRYWEGAVDVIGTHGSERVAGRGYVELTGYAE